MQVSPLDCTGCGMCARTCPGKALTMIPLSEATAQIPLWEFCDKLSAKPNQAPLTVLRGSQLQRPLFEFCGACAGCGEAPYIKLLSQLFGERISVANAPGCASAISISFGSCPYTKTESGWGPAFSVSLFESNLL